MQELTGSAENRDGWIVAREIDERPVHKSGIAWHGHDKRASVGGKFMVTELHCIREVNDEICAVCNEIREVSEGIKDVGEKETKRPLVLPRLRQLGLGAQASYAVLQRKP